MKPVVDRLTKAYAGKVDVRKMDAGRHDPETDRLWDEFGLQYVPSFVFVDTSGAVKGVVVGETSEQALRERLDALH
jgi:thioredoxin-like negative regulator of GroEL